MENVVIKMEDKVVTGLKNNPAIWIAEGGSRFSAKWKNKEIHWAELLARLRNVTMTQETQAEYFKMTKAQQDKIKDVGGFVGGTLTGGRRKTDTVKDRYLITFDLDTAPDGFVETMQLEAPYAWAIYSTHKHKASAPRFRLIAPLSRAVDPDEYEAITRKMAEEIGLEYFDSTTFQPSRLMYWPSCSRDAEFVFEYNDGKPVDADAWLNKYPDWRDVTFWPVCPDEIRVQKKRQEKQQDPLKKKGPVGTFCRTYNVPEAIETFLPDVYTKAPGKDDRYTYAAGSAFGGLVIYDDGLFCYSNHSTDPAHGMDLNAFDLVRVHKFGQEDADIAEDTPATKRPSYKEMIELIRQDPGCIKTYDAERHAAAADDFAGELTPEEKEHWKLTLQRTKQGAVETTIDNLVKIFETDENLQGIAFNDLSGYVEIVAPVPWKKELTEWKNADDSCLYVYLSRNYNDFRRADVTDVLTQIAHKRAFHPVKDYMKSLPDWDGVPRMETILIDYLGAEDCAYSREVAKRWLLAAISRIFRPGCKFDYIPVLSGPGGIGKSTLIAKLGGAWFSDSLSFEDMRDKTAAEKIQGTWLNEISELKGMRKTEVESVKSFISRQEDIYRPSYGRQVEHHKRSCVFIGTSNADDYLKDVTGNRRFWPVKCSGQTKKRPWELTADAVAQIWAEVLFYYDGLDEKTLVLPKDVEKEALEHQVAALEHDERLGLVAVYLEKLLPKNWASMDLTDRRFWLDNEAEGAEGTEARTQVSVMEIWAECFRMSPTAKKRTDSDDITRILTQLGWDKKGTQRIPLYGPQVVYIKV